MSSEKPQSVPTENINPPVPPQPESEVQQNVAQNTPTPPEIPQENAYDPLSLQDGMVQREYANQVGNAAGQEIIDRVPEPTIEAPPPPPEQTAPIPEAEKPKNPYEEPLNPGLSFLPKSDITEAAKNTANMILSGYKQGWGMVPRFITVSQTEINQLVLADKISPNLEVNRGGTPISVSEIFAEIAGQSKEAFEVSDEFINDIRPPLERELSRRGAGMSDMQYILQAVARDSIPRVQAIFQIRNATQEVLKGIQEIHTEVKLQREMALNSDAAAKAEIRRLKEENARMKAAAAQTQNPVKAEQVIPEPTPAFNSKAWKEKHKIG